jgi:hypothetical protein
MQFIKNGDASLLKGGYLVQKGTETPIFHSEFVAKQRDAHAMVLLASKVKNSDMVGKPAVTFSSLQAEVNKELSTVAAKNYVSVPTEPETPTRTSLAQDAMAWLKFEQNKSEAEKTNTLLQKFNVISEYEEFGLYFNNEEIVKLEAIYTMEEIVAALTTLTPYLKVS